MSEQKTSSVQAFVSPLSASVVRTAAQTVEKLKPTIAILRRSNISAIAPAGTDTSINGNMSAVCTSATMSAEVVRCVISHAAPTPRIN
jgi:hypothetical protein